MLPKDFGYPTVYRGTGDNDRFVIDPRYFPLVVADLRGMATDECLHSFYRALASWLAHIHTQDLPPLVLVCGLDQAKVSPPTTRKLAADYEQKYLADPKYLRSIYVVTSRIIRGAMTAISWMSGADSSKIDHVISWAEALKKANKSYENGGYPRIEVDAASYVFPEENDK